jgi:8-amino-7-oxononanoate synthase
MLSPATMKRFKHNDLDHLTRLLSDNALVVTEGVFSMDGDLAPLAELTNVTTDRAWLAVDDAHGVGVLGAQGRGSCDHAGIKPNLLIVTFGKAFGMSGAAIMCDRQVGEYLTQFARHYVYSTAMPPAQACVLTTAVDMIRNEQWRRDRLVDLNSHYDALFSSFDGYTKTVTPIKPLILGSADKAVQVAERLRAEGLWVTAIRPPTVPSGSARLRITLTANHTKQDLERLARELQRVLKEYSE